MIAVFLAPAYLGACTYVLIRIFRSLGYCNNKFKSLFFRIPVTLIYATVNCFFSAKGNSNPQSYAAYRKLLVRCNAVYTSYNSYKSACICVAKTCFQGFTT